MGGLPGRLRRVALVTAALLLTTAGTHLVAGGPGNDADPAEVGRWLQPFEGEVPAVNMILLNDGRVLYYSGVEADEHDHDPTHATFIHGAHPVDGRSRLVQIDAIHPSGVVAASVTVPDPEDGGAWDLFCSGSTVRPDGTVLAPGATLWYTLADEGTDAFHAPLKGGNQTRVFEPTTDAWVDGGDMARGRWYPSAIPLHDGRTLVASGLQTLLWPNTHNALVELYDGEEWTPLPTRVRAADALAGPEPGRLSDFTGETDPAAVGETETSIVNLPMYPRLLQVPGGPLEGKVFYSTVGTLWGPFGERPEEVLWAFQQTLDLETGDWDVLAPSVFGVRQHAAVVPLLFDPARDYAPELLTFGGTLERSVAATPLAEVADLSTNPPTNEPVAPMNHARWHHNGVLLPDGTVLAVGGGAYDNVVVHGAPNVPVNAVEQYDPETGEWTVLAEASVDRMYHSTAVLLPDGRVLAGGHVPLPAFHKAQRDTVNPQVVETRLEIFEPPYLFLDDTRPAIEDAPDEVTYGETVEIEVGNLEGDLHSVVLMRPGATTHAYDADQRGVLLDAHKLDDDRVQVTLPPEGVVAPPGHYLLFVNEDVDGKAFPSKAAFLQLG